MWTPASKNSLPSFTTFSSISLMLFSIILSSCGGGNSSVKIAGFSTQTLMSDEHFISTEERNVATRICYAYQSKSKNFRTSTFLGGHFLFSGKTVDCQNTTSNYQVNALLNYDANNELAFIPQGPFDPNLKFIKKVQTDTSGYLSLLCAKILNNEPISNTTTQTGIKVQISFIREGLDGFLLQYFVQQPDTTYKIETAEKYKVRTQIDFVNGQILGMDESYSTQKVCGNQFDKNKFSTFDQSFISR
jgi:hypothetical protein